MRLFNVASRVNIARFRLEWSKNTESCQAAHNTTVAIDAYLEFSKDNDSQTGSKMGKSGIKRGNEQVNVAHT